jgi:hypothetical protein
MTDLTAFHGDRIVARGPREEIISAITDGWSPAERNAIRVFEDGSGRVTDLDFQGLGTADAAASATRGRGRPRLGVVAREVTLLPRHWEWLGGQQGGASAALRRLVDEARKRAPAAGGGRDAAYRFMSDMCGDRPGYEEALRALYRGESERFAELIAPWPDGVRSYIAQLAG